MCHKREPHQTHANSFMLLSLCVFLRQEMASLSLAGRGWQCGGVDDDMLIL